MRSAKFALLRQLLYGCLLLASFAEVSYASQPNLLRLVTTEWPPYQTVVDGKVRGSATDTIICILQKLDQPYEITMTSWKRAQLLVEAGRQDAFFLATKTRHRDKYAVMSDALLHQTLYIYFSDQVNDRRLTPENRLRWRVSAVFGNSEWVNLYQRHFHVVGKPRDAAMLVDMLLRHRVDAVVAYSEDMDVAMKAKDLLPTRFYSSVYEEESAGIYFRKGILKRYPGFLASFNQAIPVCTVHK